MQPQALFLFLLISGAFFPVSFLTLSSVRVDEILLLLLWDNTVSDQTGVLLQKQGGIRHVKLQLTTTITLSLANPRLWAGSMSQKGGTPVLSRSETTITGAARSAVEEQSRGP